MLTAEEAAKQAREVVEKRQEKARKEEEATRAANDTHVENWIKQAIERGDNGFSLSYCQRISEAKKAELIALGYYIQSRGSNEEVIFS